MARSIRVEGARELAQSLRNAGDRETEKALRKVYRKSAQTVVTAARPKVPRRSGRLAKTLKAGSSTTGGWALAGNSSDVPYAGPVHFGWPSRPNRAKGWRGGPISPNPFLYDALDARRQEIEEAFRKGIAEVTATVHGE